MVDVDLWIETTVEVCRGANLGDRLRRRAAAREHVTRAVLSHYLGGAIDPAEIHRAPGGKPFLSNGPRFNVAHSGDVLAVAVVAHGLPVQVGVDVELRRARPRWPQIASRELPDAAVARVHASVAASQLTQFYRLWTAYEAYGKAMGVGLRVSGRDLRVERFGRRTVLSHPVNGGARWAAVHHVEPAFVACVVATAPQCRVRRRTLTRL